MLPCDYPSEGSRRVVPLPEDQRTDQHDRLTENVCPCPEAALEAYRSPHSNIQRKVLLNGEAGGFLATCNDLVRAGWASIGGCLLNNRPGLPRFCNKR